jgi:hypothetical protein
MKCIIKILFIAGISLFFRQNSAYAQQASLSLTVELNQSLLNSQVINIQSLIPANGQGPNLFRLFLKNENISEEAKGLYFNLSVRSEKNGPILNIYQLEGQPFSLDPAQMVYATNNNLGNGLPGVDEFIEFEGELTSGGKEFVNSLLGSNYLPADRYILVIEIYQGHNKQRGGVRVASATAEVRTSKAADLYSLYLLSPGNVAGSNAVVAAQYPNFQWQGIAGTSYRLILVEAREGESAQSLISGAKSTVPILLNAASTGSLIEHEMLDVIVERSSFQYPASGVQALEPGKTYYWQVFAQLKTANGIEERGSEIWSFTIPRRAMAAPVHNMSMAQRALQTVLGERFDEFMQRGYSFKSLETEDHIYLGGQALQKLMELSRKAERGEVSIIIEEL